LARAAAPVPRSRQADRAALSRLQGDRARLFPQDRDISDHARHHHQAGDRRQISLGADQPHQGLRGGEGDRLSAHRQSPRGAARLGAHRARRAGGDAGPRPLGLWFDPRQPQEPRNRAALHLRAGHDQQDAPARRIVRRHRSRRRRRLRRDLSAVLLSMRTGCDMSALERLGSYVAASGRPSEAVRETVELHLIDTVGALIASTRTVEGLGLLRFRAAMRARGQGAWALDLATRCALARLSEIDDIHLPSMTTPGAIVIPGALPAVAADAVTAAILAGTEAMTRLGRAIDGPAILYRGIWPTYFAAPFGMAAVAARLLKLDEEASAHALALALTLAAPTVGHH